MWIAMNSGDRFSLRVVTRTRRSRTPTSTVALTNVVGAVDQLRCRAPRQELRIVLDPLDQVEHLLALRRHQRLAADFAHGGGELNSA